MPDRKQNKLHKSQRQRLERRCIFHNEEVHRWQAVRLTLQSQARALQEKGEAHSSSNFSDPVIIPMDERGQEASVTWGCCVCVAPSTRPPTIKGARDTGKCLTMLRDLCTTPPGNKSLCITNKHAKCLSQLVYGLGCCLRIQTHSELLLRKFSTFLALSYFYLNQIYLLLISLVIHCGNG